VGAKALNERTQTKRLQRLGNAGRVVLTWTRTKRGREETGEAPESGCGSFSMGSILQQTTPSQQQQQQSTKPPQQGRTWGPVGG
jgi:hypothetical protein